MLIEWGLYGGVIDNPIKFYMLWPLMFNGKGWIFICEISPKITTDMAWDFEKAV